MRRFHQLREVFGFGLRKTYKNEWDFYKSRWSKKNLCKSRWSGPLLTVIFLSLSHLIIDLICTLKIPDAK